MLARRGRARPARRCPLHDPARRGLALRPPRPLLRARADPRGVPPALRRSRACSPASPSLLEHGGLNPTMYNADHEGGPRNGVMTAVDDFIAEYDRPAPARRPPDLLRAGHRGGGGACSAARRRWPSASTGSRAPTGTAALRRAGRARSASRPLISSTGSSTTAEDRIVAARQPRYLDLLKGALLDEHYLENELRIEHLVATCIDRDVTPAHRDTLRDPRAAAHRRAGSTAHGPPGRACSTPTGERARVLPVHHDGSGAPRPPRALPRRRSAPRTVPGDLVECGTGRGGGGIFLRGYLAAYGIDEPRRCGSPTSSARRPRRRRPRATRGPRSATLGSAAGPGFPDLLADLNTVRDGFDRFDLLDDRVRFLQGDARRRPSRPHRSRRSPSSASATTVDDRCGRRSSTRSTTGHPRRLRRHRRLRHARVPGRRSTSSAPGAASPSRRAGRLAGAMAWRKTVPHGAVAAPEQSEDAQVGRPAARAAGPPWIPDRPHRGRRLLQHAARGGPHAALAVPRLPARTSTTSTTR